jgi:hypothetical protein
LRAGAVTAKPKVRVSVCDIGEGNFKRHDLPIAQVTSSCFADVSDFFAR